MIQAGVELMSALRYLKTFFTNAGLPVSFEVDMSDFKWTMIFCDYEIDMELLPPYAVNLKPEDLCDSLVLCTSSSPFMRYTLNQAKFSTMVNKAPSRYADLNLHPGDDDIDFATHIFIGLMMSLVRLYGDLDEDFAAKAFNVCEELFAVNGHHKDYKTEHKGDVAAFTTFFEYFHDEIFA